MSNPWINHVKQYSHNKNMTYGQAMKCPDCKNSYDKSHSGGSMQSNVVSKMIATGKFDINKMKNPSPWLINKYGNKPIEFKSFEMLKRSLKFYIAKKNKRLPAGFTQAKSKKLHEFIELNNVSWDDLATINNHLVDFEMNKRFARGNRERKQGLRELYIVGHKQTTIADTPLDAKYYS